MMIKWWGVQGDDNANGNEDGDKSHKVSITHE